jgi:tetratricopeptide (TPR) repeat protein
MADSNYCKKCGHPLEKTTPTKISEEEYDRALPEDEQLSALLERAYRQRTQGDVAAAISLCEEALRLRPKSTSAHALLAQLYEQNGQIESAIRELETVLQLNPGSIADRVKLDELRGGALADPPRVVSPHVVVAERGANSLAPMMLGIAALIVLTLGGAFALMNRSHEAERSQPPTALTLPPSGTPTAASPAPQADNAAPGAANGTAAPPAASPYLYGLYPPLSPSPTPATPPAASSHESSYAARAASSPARNTAESRPRPHTAPIAEDDAGHILLNSSGEGGLGDGSQVVIQVSSRDGKGTEPTPSAPSSGSKGSKAAPKLSQPPVLKMMPAPSNPSSDPGLRAIAQDRKLRGDYAGAINALRQALPTAGADRGQLYQDMAYCYQQKGDKTSAVTNYQSAINEYQKLLDAGQQAERAHNGIRICQNGIKICGGE